MNGSKFLRTVPTRQQHRTQDAHGIYCAAGEPIRLIGRANERTHMPRVVCALPAWVKKSGFLWGSATSVRPACPRLDRCTGEKRWPRQGGVRPAVAVIALSKRKPDGSWLQPSQRYSARCSRRLGSSEGCVRLQPPAGSPVLHDSVAGIARAMFAVTASVSGRSGLPPDREMGSLTDEDPFCAVAGAYRPE